MEFQDFSESYIKDRADSNSIMSHIKKYSFGRMNRYYIEFLLNEKVREYISTRDTNLFGSGGDSNSDRFKIIKLNCSQVSTPARNFSLIDITDSSHDKQVPVGYSFQPISLSFTCFSDMKEKVLFEYWMDFICDPYKRTFRLFEDYVTDELKIVQMDAKNNPQYGLRLLKVFPTQVQSIALSSDPMNMPTRVDVILSYGFLETFNYTKPTNTLGG